MPRSTKCLLLAAAFVLAGSTSQLRAQNGNDNHESTANAPDTVLLKGASFGSVKFSHATHEKMTLCVNCHHESKPEKPLVSGQQKCSDCHTSAAAAPMKTSIRDAFHDVKAKTGTCMDCHIKRAERVKGIPVTCRGCHVKLWDNYRTS